MPSFWAYQVIQKGETCFNSWADPFLVPVLKKFCLCKNMKDYAYELDKDGHPEIKDC